jgi:Uncharacterized protein conserved in bacteria
MKHIIVSLIVLFTAGTLYSQNKTVDNADLILGTYWSPKKDGKIEIYKKNNKYYGKIVWGKNPRKDVNNPDPNLRDKDLIGLDFLTDFNYNKDDKEWVNGRIYDPKNGKIYKAYMWLENNNLKVKGYIGVSFLGRSELFERVK